MQYEASLENFSQIPCTLALDWKWTGQEKPISNWGANIDTWIVQEILGNIFSSSTILLF